MESPMKLRTLFLYLLIFLSTSVLAQENKVDLHLDFESYDPPSTLVVPEHLISRAKFPFIDVHSHQWRMADQDLSELVKQMDAMNMGIMVNLSGRGGDRLKAMMDNVNAHYPERFAIFTNINFNNIDEPGWTEKSTEQLANDFNNGAKGLKIYKNLGMGINDKNGKRVRIDDPRIDAIWTKCAELGIPVIIHSADPKPFWSAQDSLNERWLELKTHQRRKRSNTNPAPWEQIIQEQHNIFKKHPKTTFIAAHMGWFANDLHKLATLLDDMPNMYVGIGAVIAELGRQPRMAKRFFEKYQNRVLFGKDSYQPNEFPTYFRVLESNDEYFPYYKRYHAFWKMYGLDLSNEVLKKLYYKNALNIIPGLDKSLFPE